MNKEKGILKLKNSQVEASLGDYGVVHPRSTRVRLVIMAILMDEIQKEVVIQNISDPIACSKLYSMSHTVWLILNSTRV